LKGYVTRAIKQRKQIEQLSQPVGLKKNGSEIAREDGIIASQKSAEGAAEAKEIYMTQVINAALRALGYDSQDRADYISHHVNHDSFEMIAGRNNTSVMVVEERMEAIGAELHPYADVVAIALKYEKRRFGAEEISLYIQEEKRQQLARTQLTKITLRVLGFNEEYVNLYVECEITGRKTYVQKASELRRTREAMRQRMKKMLGMLQPYIQSMEMVLNGDWTKAEYITHIMEQEASRRRQERKDRAERNNANLKGLLPGAGSGLMPFGRRGWRELGFMGPILCMLLGNRGIFGLSLGSKRGMKSKKKDRFEWIGLEPAVVKEIKTLLREREMKEMVNASLSTGEKVYFIHAKEWNKGTMPIGKAAAKKLSMKLKRPITTGIVVQIDADLEGKTKTPEENRRKLHQKLCYEIGRIALKRNGPLNLEALNNMIYMSQAIFDGVIFEPKPETLCSTLWSTPCPRDSLGISWITKP